ncbi:hypothetical protein OG455_27225 [Kitasatospora sp. NBC_01287]|uniref:hypothetical protein n=1 Tax=Kitasatospora sp. NBC_01287 TaxID=2903573 RepID=UPI0022591420|nr:hypothetical protein [Kitasatospora sp. NBC_01287]MCX4749156.1 hypothetical protein [Kitasatospora sp. NBC_01287]
MHHLLQQLSDEVTVKVLVFALSALADLIRQARDQRSSNRTGRQRPADERPWLEQRPARPTKAAPRPGRLRHRGRAGELHRVKTRFTLRAAQPAPVVPARALPAPRRTIEHKTRPGNRRS